MDTIIFLKKGEFEDDEKSIADDNVKMIKRLFYLDDKNG